MLSHAKPDNSPMSSDEGLPLACEGVKIPDASSPPELYSKEMLSDKCGTLNKYCGGWIKGNRLFVTEFWEMGYLLKHVSVATAGIDKTEDKDDAHLVIAVWRDNNILEGVSLMKYGEGMTKAQTRKLADSKKVVFVMDGVTETPKWLRHERYADLTLQFDHPELQGLYVAELKCVEFSAEDHYQVLAPRATTGQVPWVLWEEARMMGEHARREAEERPPLSSRITHPVEWRNQLKMEGKKHVEIIEVPSLEVPREDGRLSRPDDIDPNADAQVNSQGTGATIMLNGLDVSADGDEEDGAGEDDGKVSDGGQSGRKRKQSEADGDEGVPLTQAERKKLRVRAGVVQPAKRVVEPTTQPRLTGKPLRGLKDMVMMNQIFSRGVPMKGKKVVDNSIHIIPADADYLASADSAQYAESEGKNAYAYQAAVKKK